MGVTDAEWVGVPEELGVIVSDNVGVGDADLVADVVTDSVL